MLNVAQSSLLRMQPKCLQLVTDYVLFDKFSRGTCFNITYLPTGT